MWKKVSKREQKHCHRKRKIRYCEKEQEQRQGKEQCLIMKIHQYIKE